MQIDAGAMAFIWLLILEPYTQWNYQLHKGKAKLFQTVRIQKGYILHNLYEKIPLGSTGYRNFRLYSENGGRRQFQRTICAD